MNVQLEMVDVIKTATTLLAPITVLAAQGIYWVKTNTHVMVNLYKK